MAILPNKGQIMDFFHTFTKGVNRPVLTYAEKTSALQLSEAEISSCPLLWGRGPIGDISNLMIESWNFVDRQTLQTSIILGYL